MDNKRLESQVKEKAALVSSIANKLRGPYTPEKYGNVIIPMSIIRRFDCILAEKNTEIKQLLAVSKKIKDITPEKIEDMISKQCQVSFYNEKCVTLEDLIGDSDNIDNNFLEFIGAYSPNIQVILEKLNFREEVKFMIKKGLLFEVVKSFAEVDFHPNKVSPMTMGYIFEEIIRTYKANAEAGDHYTPREVIKLCVELMMSENVEKLTCPGTALRIYDGCCGTGGMLTTTKHTLIGDEFNMNATDIMLYGQEINPESYAICCAEMLMLGDDPDNIREENTLTNDMFRGEKFDLLITNPPFGHEWKTDKTKVEAELKRPDNRFVAGTPRVSDGQLLFLENLIAKAEKNARIAIILNGSPLFSGDAGSGESEIRRYVLENHLLEAIVALPDQMFYNTGISTYIWILSKNQTDRRKGKVQLINAVNFYKPQTPSLGNKRKMIDEKSMRKIVEIYNAFEESEVSKIFDVEDFGYTKVTIEMPLYDDEGNKVVKRGVVQVDSSKRDTENIPLKIDIDEYIKEEVLPYAPDAFADRSKDKLGYEIPFTRYFYKYEAPRKSSEILAEIKAQEKILQEALAAVLK